MIAAVTASGHLFAQDVSQISSVQYWIDDNHTAATVGSDMEFDVDCSSLSPGLHTIHYRVADEQGKYSSLYSHGFLKVATPQAATKIEQLQYWWDDALDNAVTNQYTAEEFTLLTEGLPNGLHSLKYRVKDDTGKWSALKCHYFFKGEALEDANIVSYTYWWNDLYDKAVTTALETPAKTFELDEDFTVPEEARTGFAGHYTARLNIVVTDNRGCTALLSSDVKYPDNDAPATEISMPTSM